MNANSTDWLCTYPELEAIEGDAWLLAVSQARLVEFAENQVIFNAGDTCENYLLIIAGSVKIKKTTTDGHEITLYHIEKGQTCTLTTRCLLSGRKYIAQAVCNTAVKAIFIPRMEFERALVNSTEFRRFIYKTLDQGVENLVSLIENIAFTSTHQRLAKYLLEQHNLQHPIETTHNGIANELGTAREVISRLLKEFERRGWIKLHRGKIEIFNMKSLAEVG